MRKMTATVMMFFLRPNRSDRRPPTSAPTAAPTVSPVVTRDSSKADSPKPPASGDSLRNGSAPEITPVS